MLSDRAELRALDVAGDRPRIRAGVGAAWSTPTRPPPQAKDVDRERNDRDAAMHRPQSVSFVIPF